ncbi:MAG: FliI/YscN family ATPase [Phycisphaerales bacterium]|nr:FliI/YscN family ATPase [Phycisphaerales bacterium]MCB9857039.1 FliI/YscN family ATPase [Phycisphaerales bacterium]MCB9861834.1 FliI/YscN family ATPase [Phycisphaerales bacterium]
MTALAEAIQTVERIDTLGVTGRVRSVAGLTIHAVGLPASVGACCEIDVGFGRSVPAEVIGFRRDETLLMPLDDANGLTKGQRIRRVTQRQTVPVGPGLLGRVVDAMARPMDDRPAPAADAMYEVHRDPPDAMRRPRIDAPISVGIRSINSMLTIGGGQRVGIFSGTGVGKSVLLGMMARYTSADVAVIALVGERGREVRDFIEKDLGEEGRKRSVLVVSTSDRSPPQRLRACFTATSIAEYFRDRGANVLLLTDSVTRMAMAARQIGLAAGEPPATKGYPPSVFGAIPRLLERSGRSEHGSITGVYTVLVEGDDLNDPISDAVRGTLDGHIVLSRRLANRGQFPAVDVLQSISRVMPDVTTDEHRLAVQKVRRTMAVWDEIEDLVNIGAYARGTNAEYDLAIEMRTPIEEFLRQGMSEGFDVAASITGIRALAERMAAFEQQRASAKKEPAPEPTGRPVARGGKR